MKKFFGVLAGLLPIVTFAQVQSNGYQPNASYIETGANSFLSLLNTATNILIVLAFLYFLWVVIQFITAKDDKRTEKRNNMIWGVIGLFVMVGVWGLVRLLGQVTGVDQRSSSDTALCPPGTTPYTIITPGPNYGRQACR